MLTDKELAALKPDPTRRIEVFDSEVPGLAVRVNLGGSKTWVLFYRNASGQQRRFTLGRYPDVTLKEARKRARGKLNRISDGADPAAEKKATKAAETFGELAAEYLKVHAKPHKRSWHEDERMLNADLLPAWKARKVRGITRREVRELLEAIAERGAPTAANRVWALISTIFNFGIRRDWLESNPASLIDRRPETSRDRVLTSPEVQALWAALEDATVIHTTEDEPAAEHKAPVVPPMIARGLQVLLLTAQRPGEVFGMRWRDLDLPDDWQTNDQAIGWWTIPEALSKNREVHRVPLAREVLTILRGCLATAPDNNPWVFGGAKGGSVAGRAKKAAAQLSKRLGFEFHRHDLRRTAATGMAEAGIARETIAKVLNHVDRGARMTAVYARYSYDAEKRIALETWARRLTGILSEQPGKVLPMRSVV